MKPSKILYTAHATSTGGPGGGTNPQQLFTAGYAACFGSSIEFVTRQQKIDIGSVTVSADVGIGPSGSGFGLQVALLAKISGVDRATGEGLIARAHEVCPYSNATRGNIDVTIRADG